MSEPEVSMKRERKLAVSILVHKEVWKTFQTLTAAKKVGGNGKPMSASEHVEELVLKANAEMAGMEQPQVTVSLADLENRHKKLEADLSTKRGVLVDHGTHKALWALVASMGLDDSFAQADKVIDELWKMKDAKTLEYTDSDIQIAVEMINLHVQLHDVLAKKEPLLRKRKSNQA
jgi:hypothetical protein